MTSIRPIPSVRTGAVNEVPDVRITHTAKGLQVAVVTSLYTAAFTVTGSARGQGEAIRLTYNGAEVTVPGRAAGSGAKSALLVGQELQAALQSATEAFVTGAGDSRSYAVTVVHI